MVKKIVILGAGISGLATAWYLKKKHGSAVDIKIIEKENRAGGWIKTISHEGFLFECGPRSFRASGSGINTLELAIDLGLRQSIILSSPDAAQRYLWSHHKLNKIPHSVTEFFSQPWMWKYLPAILAEPFRSRSTQEETIAQFFSRRFSPAFTEQFIDPMVSGVFAGDIDHLSLEASFPIFKKWERDHGSLILAMLKHTRTKHADSTIQAALNNGLFTFKDGSETLIRALSDSLQKELQLNTTVEKMLFSDNGVIITCNEKQSEVHHVISTLPATSLSTILPSKRIEERVNRTKHATIAVIHFGFEKPPRELKGFGYLVPRNENLPILGTVWDSSVFPEQNAYSGQTRLTVMIGGTRFPDIEFYSEQNLIELGKIALRRQMNINQTPDIAICHVAQQAIPQYGMKHNALCHELQTLSSHLSVIGNNFFGLSVNACIESAQIIANQRPFQL